jgi:phosphoribosylanthranilate isomerase
VPVRVKICGLTNIDDAFAAVEAGADALGFVFYRNSPRVISPQKAADIIIKLPPFITTVGVFVNEAPGKIEEIIALTNLDVVQLHGSEPPEACTFSRRAVKALRVRSLDSLNPLVHYRGYVTAFLLDTFSPDVFGGTGKIFNWDIAIYAKQFGDIIIAGGLTPENVAEAVKHVRPYAVDVSSGIESEKRKKDQKKMRLFIEKAKGA